MQAVDRHSKSIAAEAPRDGGAQPSRTTRDQGDPRLRRRHGAIIPAVT
jgi:hypothetical protein